MSNILLATKIRVPPLRRDLVNRLELARRLNEAVAQNSRLILFSAPAGYGKSTLLSAWARQADHPVAWLSLEKSENNPARFWEYFFTALSTLPDLGRLAARENFLQDGHPALEVDDRLAGLVNDLARLETGAILVLDDLHAITNSQVHHSLAGFIDHLPLSPGGLRLVVSSRMDPPWPLARWRARGELAEVRAADLRFSCHETGQFLNEYLHLELSERDVAALQERTEGWIAGLQMAGVSIRGWLSAQGPAGVSRFIETFTGSNRFIVDYLVEEVIAQQSEEVRDFLQKTSLLEQLCAPLCDAVLERQDSRALLEQVERENLFLFPLDDEQRWYRYHHLFGELMLKRYKQSQPAGAAEYHRRASQWYAGNHFLVEAIHHTLKAGDVARVNDLVAGNALAMVEHSELLEVAQLFERIPEDQFCAKPWLCVALAWVKAYIDPSGEVERVLQHALEGLEALEPAPDRARLLCHIDAIRAYVAWVRGEAARALAYARQALENAAEDEWIERTHLWNIMGLALQYTGDLPAAIQSFEAAIDAGQRSGRFELCNAHTNLAYVFYLQGRLRQAFSHCQQVLRRMERDGQPVRPAVVLTYAYATMSLVQLEWNEVEQAAANAREAIALAEQWKQADALHFALTSLSRALVYNGDLETASTVNQRATRLAEDVSPWFYRLSACNDAWIDLAKGDLAAAAKKLEEVDALAGEKDQNYTFLIVKASLLYASGNYRELLASVEPALVDLDRREMRWHLLNLLPLQALALRALNQKDEALAKIVRCLTLAEPEGFARIFLERGAPMRSLLSEALEWGVEARYIQHLLPFFEGLAAPRQSTAADFSPAPPASPAAGLIEPLSQREIQVLRLLDSPLTSGEIGRELYLSVNTVRTHMRNIYAKLGVSRRGDAVRQAKALKVL